MELVVEVSPPGKQTGHGKIGGNSGAATESILQSMQLGDLNFIQTPVSLVEKENRTQ